MALLYGLPAGRVFRAAVLVMRNRGAVAKKLIESGNGTPPSPGTTPNVTGIRIPLQSSAIQYSGSILPRSGPEISFDQPSANNEFSKE